MEGIIETLRKMVETQPERIIYNFLDCEKEPFGEDKVTIKELYAHINDMAAALKAKGARKGDRAVILSMQDAGTVYAVLGCIQAGVVFTVVPPPLDDSKLNRFVSVLKSCHPRFLISNKSMEDASGINVTPYLLKKAFFDVVGLKRLYTDKVRPCHKDMYIPHQKDDLIYLQYTSGSTSAPKGVMITYGNLQACIEQVKLIFNWNEDDNNLAIWVPFYHNIGLIASMFIPLTAEHGIAYEIPTLQFLAKPTVWLKVLSDYKVNITAAPNSAYDALASYLTQEQADQYDLRHVTHLINGSEFVDSRTVERFCDLFHLDKSVFAAGYGLSECVCVATLASREYVSQTIDPDAYREGRFIPTDGEGKTVVSVGHPAGDMKILAVREDGSVCDPNEIGEIYIQGSSIASGYFQNEEETKRFHATVKGETGEFYRTGDMGIMYKGYLYLTGRIKEMIIVSGKNIFPSDIILSLHEEGYDGHFRAVTVFSVQTASGEKPILAAECDPGVDYEFIARQVNRHIAEVYEFSFHDVVFVPVNSLPRTDNGKVRTLATKQLYEEEKLPVVYSTRKEHGTVAEEAQTIEFEIPENTGSEEIQQTIRTVFVKMLGTTSFRDSDSFLELGGDSLRMMELAGTLERVLKKPIDIRKIAADPSVNGVSAYIQQVLSGNEESGKKDLYAECVLPEEITPSGDYGETNEAKTVFLTGATGFLGAYLIRSLIMQRKNEDFCIVCHARAKDRDKALERVIGNMKRFNTWEEEYRKYLRAVPGDLNKAKLGLSAEDWRELTASADIVIHNGAQLNFILPYDQLKQTNVIGTQEALRFACAGKPKYFNYISSYSVYDNPSHFGQNAPEDDPLESSEGYFLGYSETKWVSEKLVKIAESRGLRTAIHRPGDITGTKEDGIWKLEDLISRSIVGCVQLGYVPDMEVNLHLTPVDYVADAIVCIALQERAYGHAFNIINTDIPSLREIYLLFRKFGYEQKMIPYEEWCQKLTDCKPSENVLRILSVLFTDQRQDGQRLYERYGVNEASFSKANTDELLAGRYHCPPLDENLMAAYLKYFYSCGYIPKPKIW